MINSIFWTSTDLAVTVNLAEVVAFYMDDDEDWVVVFRGTGDDLALTIQPEDAPSLRKALHKLHTVKELP